MKPIRMIVLALALGCLSVPAVPAVAQQEVDPEHFDQPAAAHVNAPAHTVHRHAKASAANPPRHHARVASKHSTGKTRHHAGRAA